MLAQAEGSSLFELVETMIDGYSQFSGSQLSSKHHFELVGVRQRAAQMVKQLDDESHVSLLHVVNSLNQ